MPKVTRTCSHGFKPFPLDSRQHPEGQKTVKKKEGNVLLEERREMSTRTAGMFQSRWTMGQLTTLVTQPPAGFEVFQRGLIRTLHSKYVRIQSSSMELKRRCCFQIRSERVDMKSALPAVFSEIDSLQTVFTGTATMSFVSDWSSNHSCILLYTVDKELRSFRSDRLEIARKYPVLYSRFS